MDNKLIGLLIKDWAFESIHQNAHSGVEIADLLIKNGANVNHLDRKRKTALVSALLLGNL